MYSVKYDIEDEEKIKTCGVEEKFESLRKTVDFYEYLMKSENITKVEVIYPYEREV